MGNQKSINCSASGLQIQFFFLYIKGCLLPTEKMEVSGNQVKQYQKRILWKIVDVHRLSKIFIMYFWSLFF